MSSPSTGDTSSNLEPLPLQTSILRCWDLKLLRQHRKCLEDPGRTQDLHMSSLTPEHPEGQGLNPLKCSVWARQTKGQCSGQRGQ